MSAIEKWMKNWKGDWAFMEQPEKDLYMAVEVELAAMQSVIGEARKGCEVAEEHRNRYNTQAIAEGGKNSNSNYWSGRRDEAGYFRDRLAAALTKLDGLK